MNAQAPPEREYIYRALLHLRIARVLRALAFPATVLGAALGSLWTSFAFPVAAGIAAVAVVFSRWVSRREKEAVKKYLAALSSKEMSGQEADRIRAEVNTIAVAGPADLP